MDRNNVVLIKMNNFDDIKEYANAVIKFDSDINIYLDDVHYYDGKSIMAILALNISQPKYVEIVSDDIDEINRFKEAMSKFTVEK